MLCVKLNERVVVDAAVLEHLVALGRYKFLKLVTLTGVLINNTNLEEQARDSILETNNRYCS